MTQTLTSAARELIRRPSDEHLSLPEFRAAALRDRSESREIRTSPQSVLFSSVDDSAKASLATLRIDVGDGAARPLSHYALQQCSRYCGTGPDFLSRLTGRTASRVLNETFPRDNGATDRLALVNPSGALRAMTSDSYSRLWDADILDEVKRWVLGAGWIPAVPTKNFLRDSEGRIINAAGNDTPALFRGDRDSFQFYYSPVVDRPDLGGLRKGLVIYNSEVGARSFGFDTFDFRDMCANFLIWDAQGVSRRRAVHRGRVRLLFRDLVTLLQGYSVEAQPEHWTRYDVAAKALFATDADKAAERLSRQFDVTQVAAKRITSDAHLAENQGAASWDRPALQDGGPLSYFAIAQGATFQAHDESNADAKAEWARLGGDILAAASA